MKNCEESFELIYRFIDGDLDGVSCHDIEIHLKACRPCWDRFEFERKLIARLKTSCCEETCSERLKKRIRDFLEKY